MENYGIYESSILYLLSKNEHKYCGGSSNGEPDTGYFNFNFNPILPLLLQMFSKISSFGLKKCSCIGCFGKAKQRGKASGLVSE